MRGHQQSRIKVRFHRPLNALLIERDVLLRRNRHKRVRHERLRVHARLQFPFLPAVVVLRGSQTKGLKRLRLRKHGVAPFPRKKPTQERMVRLTYHYNWIALLLKNHHPFNPPNHPPNHPNPVPLLSPSPPPDSRATPATPL